MRQTLALLAAARWDDVPDGRAEEAPSRSLFLFRRPGQGPVVGLEDAFRFHRSIRHLAGGFFVEW